ncbi:MAG TPA: complex I NDUFA9 subunit family protein [Pseudomonas sp.]|uniref:complex I NDUFA9 subunit family protein n=1 Tax=Pseudomonas sp. TaxID=306 RepID=UPI002CD792B2|nr:complex I NDUFA9 subunit family protein [Pseudomonas sp.]HRL93248.1 complex I NDUFA9 subunit family protein [Pseudomonas sp.]
MNILLTGASGFLGRNIATRLRAAGHQVRPVCRSQGVDFAHMLDPADWLPLLAGVDAVINCVGIIGETATQRFQALHATAPQALFRACASAGVRRVVQVSALGADAQAFSAYHRSKLAADDCLRSLALDWFVLRPALIYGHGGTSAQLFMALARLPLLPVIGSGEQAVQPVHIRDVVDGVLACLVTEQTRQTLDIVGAETLTFKQWLHTLRAAQGLTPCPTLRIPLRLALAVAWLGHHFSPLLQPDNLRMLQAGYRGDTQAFSALLGRRPLAFAPALLMQDAATAQTGSTPCSI